MYKQHAICDEFLLRGCSYFLFFDLQKKIEMRSLIIYKKNRVENTSLVPIVLT